ncbi:MAG TPA: ABC transporter ATP-binding protein [Candidatus Mcinerneyibacterium sp.]|nr:ABC transporter ATP-binding protein [Candidatus Mcinerneyibacterium sp.]
MKFKERIKKEWKPFKYRFFFLLFITVVSALLRTAIPYFYKFIIDLLKDKAPIGELDNYIYMILILSVSRFLIYAYFQSNRAMMNMRFQWNVRSRAFNNLLKAGKLKFAHINVGEIVTRLSDDTEKLTWFLSSGIFRGLDAILIFGLSLFYMVTLSPFLTIFTLVTLLFVVIFFFIIKTFLHNAYSKLQTSISEVNDYINSTFNGISIIKGYNREEKLRDYFKTMIKNRKEDEMRVVKLDRGTMVFYQSLPHITTIVVIFVGGYMVINNEITLGTLVAFFGYIKNLIHPMLDIGTLFVRGKRAAVSSGRIAKLENIDYEETEGKRKIDFNDSIILKNVDFEFEDTEILKNINLEIKKGEKIAVMGKIGSGKSFLSLLLSGVIKPTSGQIFVDGINLEDIDIKNYRDKIGYAPQQPIVFSDTIKNNILMGDEIDQERYEYSVKTSQFEDELKKFGMGFDTEIGPKGNTLSGGQKQRLALARALYKKPPVLILDDITSALDAETEMNLWKELFETIPDQTLILVTHRPKSAELVDKILILEDGKIIEKGTHRDLLNKESYYKEIYMGASE